MNEDCQKLTIGSDCKMAERNSDEAEGTASNARIMLAPLLWPARVILEALPPNDGTTLFKNLRELTTSFTARLVVPLGAMKPSYTRFIKLCS